jgi:hypothetical protein
MKLLAQRDAGRVTQVIVCDSVEWAETRLGGTWIETKIDGSERARYAGIGYVYIPDIDAFLPPQPAFNWHVDGVTKNWIFPEGDHLYIPADPLLIENLSRGLHKLIDPDRDGLFAGIIWHPGGTDVAWPLLQLREVDQIPISLQADTQPLAEVLQAFVDGGGLTTEEVQDILDAVQVMAGEVVLVKDFIPPSWQPYVMTKEQAIAGGWFDSSSEQVET